MVKDKKRVLRIIIAVVVAAVIAVAVFFAGFFTRGLTAPSEVNTLEWILNTIEDNYYFYGDFDKTDAANSSFAAIAGKLDRYSEYYTKEEYAALQAENGGAKSGVGISYNYIQGTGAYVANVVGNSPARRAGLSAGDLIVSASSDKGSFNAAQGSAQEFSNFLSGFGAGENITFSCASGKSVTLAKENYTASYTYMSSADTAWEFRSSADGGLALYENKQLARDYLPAGAAYINLSQFYGTAAREFGVLIEKFNAQGCNSLVLDLRNNGGGFVSVMQDLAGYFTSALQTQSSAAMIAEYKNGNREVYDFYRHGGNSLVPAGTEVYVLANSNTASASEALIGVLVSYGILEYKNIFISDYSQSYLDWVGSGAKTAQTYGKGIMQTTFVNYPKGDALKLTTARILWPNGKCIHDVALSASDGCTVVPDVSWTVTLNDEELQSVIQIIKSR